MTLTNLFISLTVMTFFASAQGETIPLQLIHSCKPIQDSIQHSLKGYIDFEIVKDTKTNKVYVYSPGNKFSDNQNDLIGSHIPNNGFARMRFFENGNMIVEENAIPLSLNVASETLVKSLSERNSDFQGNLVAISIASLLRKEELYIFPGASSRGMAFNNVVFLKRKDPAYNYTSVYLPITVGAEKKLVYVLTHVCDRKTQ